MIMPSMFALSNGSVAACEHPWASRLTPILDTMQVVLGIETATTSVGVALVAVDGPLRARFDITPSRRHAETIAPAIEFLLAQAGAKPSDIVAVAVDIGPGLFTGIRVGIAAAAGFAYAAGCNVVGVRSTDVVATRQTGMSASAAVAVVLDARRKELYAAVPGLLEPFVGSPRQVAQAFRALGVPLVLVGEGVSLVATHLEADGFSTGELLPPDPLTVAEIGRSEFLAGRAVGPEALVPLYLRAPDAQITWDTRHGAAADREPDRIVI
jgi:tRNA threonylcarbamoyladenosine biosynthesis protein TsaB